MLLGAVFIVFGLFMIVAPKLFYKITQGWKNDSETEPSNLFVISTRFGGVIFIVVGIAAIVIRFVK